QNGAGTDQEQQWQLEAKAPWEDSAESREARRAAQPSWLKLRRGMYIDSGYDTQFNDAWLILGLLVTVVGLILQIQFLLSAALVLFVVAGAGWLWNRLSLFGLHYERRFSETRAFQGETIELTLEVRNQKFLPLPLLEITDVFPKSLSIDQGQVVVNRANNLGEYRTFWMPGAFQRLTRRVAVHCTHRGYHLYGPASVKTGDGFGFFSRRATHLKRERLIVYPRLYSVAELGLPAKNPFGEQGAQERLFEDPLRTIGVREWQPADNLRRVHWKATARHQQLLSRVYEPSEEMQLLIFLNVATMVRHWLGNIPELLERTISVAGSLAALCAERRWPVGLIANGVLPGSDQPLRLLPGRSPNQLLRILELLAAVTPFASQPIETMLLREAPRLPWGATLLVVTAIAHDDLLAVLADLDKAGRQIVLFTLAEEPPASSLPGVIVYHLPHLIEDLIAPAEVAA
ncbi:MAG: DUF58 domain-containing protein, partial [Anaerolineae bacterium]